ncbi:MAG: hypothetical protein LAO76_01485 [Acidobacteriia bacterium]|nr:hypothetical protein [Terriglobia bacterium]
MSNVSSTESIISRLAAQADAMGRLAQDSGAFAATVAAFESKDANAFRWVLERQEMLPYCELICEWVRIKLCALRCAEICRPLPEKTTKLPSLQHFARAVADLSAKEESLRRLVDAVACGDGSAYHAILAELKLGEFCQLLCHWICAIGYRRICEVVCRVQPPIFVDPVHEIRAAGRALGELVANEKAFSAIEKAALAGNCEVLRSAITRAGFIRGCEVICRLICTHRCVRVCREFCEVFPIAVLRGALAIEEAQNFALAARQLAGHPRELYDLVNAVQTGNVEAYREIVARFGFGPYCWQVCSWICTVSCHEFCFCVCPPPGTHPWFTSVGYFDISGDINPGTGKTNKSLPFPSLGTGGGPNYAFYGALQLGGFCPIDSPTTPGEKMKYRFLYNDGSGDKPITGNLVSPVKAGERQILWPTIDGAGNATGTFVTIFQDIIIQSSPLPPDPTPPAVGHTWVAPKHYIAPDPTTGWIEVDPSVIGGGFKTLLGFDTAQVVPGGPPLPGVPAGTAVPAAAQRAGQDLSITFEAARLGASTADFSNSLDKIHINNWLEVIELNFAEFVTGCCTPIDKKLSVQFTVDHEEMDSGSWGLSITSCSPSAPGNITPTTSGPGVTVSARGGSGTIVEDTTSWSNCSYTVDLGVRAGLTTGLRDNEGQSIPLTFAICGH